MSFERVPDEEVSRLRRQYVAVINPSGKMPHKMAMSTPSAELFRQEYLKWVEIHKMAMAHNKDMAIRVSDQVRPMLGKTAKNLVIQDALRQPERRFSPFQSLREHLFDQSQGATLLGFAYLLRQPSIYPWVEHSIEAGLIKGEEASANFLHDYSGNDPVKTGFHASNQVLEAMGFDAMQPGDDLWYISDTIFMHVVCPAKPTLDFFKTYQLKMGYELDQTILPTLATVTARVKKTVWTGTDE